MPTPILSETLESLTAMNILDQCKYMVRLRNELNLTHINFAKAMGISLKSIERWDGLANGKSHVKMKRGIHNGLLHKAIELQNNNNIGSAIIINIKFNKSTMSLAKFNEFISWLGEIEKKLNLTVVLNTDLSGLNISQ